VIAYRQCNLFLAEHADCTLSFTPLISLDQDNAATWQTACAHCEKGLSPTKKETIGSSLLIKWAFAICAATISVARITMGSIPSSALAD
jgi:hypothetical protein